MYRAPHTDIWLPLPYLAGVNNPSVGNPVAPSSLKYCPEFSLLVNRGSDDQLAASAEPHIVLPAVFIQHFPSPHAEYCLEGTTGIIDA